jgi:dienelactone hydrolase
MGVNHGFRNDTTPRYDETAAKLAWQRTELCGKLGDDGMR